MGNRKTADIAKATGVKYESKSNAAGRHKNRRNRSGYLVSREGNHSRAQEREALLAGIDAGMALIDTAEMYGEGKAEELVGETISGLPRENLFLVSKVYPHNAGEIGFLIAVNRPFAG